jgi:hypothetical protein
VCVHCAVFVIGDVGHVWHDRATVKAAAVSYIDTRIMNQIAFFPRLTELNQPTSDAP